MAFIFNVKENGRTHTVGMFGGTILGQARIPTEGLNQYLRSIDHYLEFAKKMNVDVEIQNHALFDDTPGRLARLKTRKPGDPNPFADADRQVHQDVGRRFRMHPGGNRPPPCYCR